MTDSEKTVAPGLYLLVEQGDPMALRMRRDALLETASSTSSEIERIDLAEGDPRQIIMAATAPSLFGGERVVLCEHFELFPQNLAGELKKAVSGGDAVIIATAYKMPHKSVVEAAEVQKFGQPRGAQIQARIGEIATKHNVELTQAQIVRLAKSGVADWDELNNALRKLGDLGGGSVSQTDVAALEAAVTGEPPPWDLSDAIERGDAATALQLCEARRVSAYATFAYLANRARDLGMVREVMDERGGSLSPEEIQKLCGISHPFPAKKLGELARRTPTRVVRRLWEVIAQADMAMRNTSDADQVVARTAVAMARVFASH